MKSETLAAIGAFAVVFVALATPVAFFAWRASQQGNFPFLSLQTLESEWSNIALALAIFVVSLYFFLKERKRS